MQQFYFRYWVGVLITVLCLGSFSLDAQVENRVHSLSWRVSGTISGSALAKLGTASYLHLQKDTLDLLTIEALDPHDIWRPNRIATKYWSPGSAKASDVVMLTAIASPLALLADHSMRNDGWTISAMYLQTFMLTFGVTALTKEIFKHNRPYNYNPLTPNHYKFSRDARSSFFSGHTSITAASTFFVASVFSGFYQERDWRWATVWTAAATIPLGAGILRLTAGKHFPTDIVVGYGVGATIGWLVPYLHSRF